MVVSDMGTASGFFNGVTEAVMSATRIRVLCVDDHPLVRDGIAYALQSQIDMELVAEATTGQEAIEAFRMHRPDVTLMDLQMPGMSGIEATAEIRKEFPHARIVILTTYAGDIQASRALKLGAVGYLLKGTLRTELLDTIRQVYGGHRHIPPEIASEIANHYGADALSQREIEVLREVSVGSSNKIVADKLFITEDTVKGHMKSILAKLQANDRTHAVMIAVKRGFIEG
jgi:DNA-binding NarL/FixJ family response regulator